MKNALVILGASLCLAPVAGAQSTPRTVNIKEIVELELLTHTEVYDKIHVEGMTSVIIAIGGTEERGPHAILGGHTIMARNKAIEIAKKLGKTLVAPTLPIAVAATGLREGTNQPGGLQLSAEVFKAVQLAQIQSMAMNGFKDIFIMGDHGGGQNEMRQAAEEEDARLSPNGVRVYYIGDFYSKFHTDADKYFADHQLPTGGHGAMLETSEMLFWEPIPGLYIRPSFKTLPIQPAGAGRAGGGGGRGGVAAPGGSAGSPLLGLTGDPRPATREIGKDIIDIGVNNAVAQIRKLMAERRGGTH